LHKVSPQNLHHAEGWRREIGRFSEEGVGWAGEENGNTIGWSSLMLEDAEHLALSFVTINAQCRKKNVSSNPGVWASACVFLYLLFTEYLPLTLTFFFVFADFLFVDRSLDA
jgi:hypothetical protein